MANDVEHLFLCLLTSPISSLEKCCLNLLTILINFNLKSHVWLEATTLNSVVHNRNAAFRNSETLKENMKEKRYGKNGDSLVLKMKSDDLVTSNPTEKEK